MGDGRREESTYYKTKKIDSDLALCLRAGESRVGKSAQVARPLVQFSHTVIYSRFS